MAYLTPRRKVPRHGPVGIESPDGHATSLRVSNPEDMAMDIGSFGGSQPNEDRDRRR